jgi:hypothetical protein
MVRSTKLKGHDQNTHTYCGETCILFKQVDVNTFKESEIFVEKVSGAGRAQISS